MRSEAGTAFEFEGALEGPMRRVLALLVLTLVSVPAIAQVQYRATDGRVNDYHLVHLGKFALG